MNAAPAAVTPIETQPGHVVTTEATGKTHKIVQAVGAGVFLLGLVSCAFTGVGEANTGSISWMLIGAVIYLAGGIGAWWHHA